MFYVNNYDIHTRLLDWTKDIYVAIYFAIQNLFLNNIDEVDKEKNMVIWAFNFKKIKEYNLYCTELNEDIEYENSLKEKNSKFGMKIGCSEDKSIETYNEEIYKYNLKVKEYNNKFKDREYKEYKRLLISIFLIVSSYYENPNINAQKGALLYQKICYSILEKIEMVFKFKKIKDWARSKEYKTFKLSLDEIIVKYIDKDIAKKLEINNLFYKFIISRKEFFNIMRCLYKLGYDAAKIFPGYYDVSKKIF